MALHVILLTAFVMLLQAEIEAQSPYNWCSQQAATYKENYEKYCTRQSTKSLCTEFLKEIIPRLENCKGMK
ncbi:unnamed protein product [Dicrocoelium dendriticum]|nr:unnamed protein product [Dicrocoelium dendriticum]